MIFIFYSLFIRKKKLMEIISPDAAKEYIREHENKTFDLNKDRLIQKLPVIDFKN